MTEPNQTPGVSDREAVFRDREAFKRWNDEMAQKYDPEAYHAHPNPVVRTVERMRVRKLIALLDVKPGQRVLEVGCGAGNILEQVKGGELHGIDLSPWLLEKARRRLGGRAELREGFAEELPYADGHFDRVYSSEVLEHVADPEKVLREMRRVVRTDGRVVVSFPNEALIDRVKDGLMATGLWRFFEGNRDKGDYEASARMKDEWHLHELTVDAVRWMVRDFFRVERVAHVPNPVAPLRHVLSLRPR